MTYGLETFLLLSTSDSTSMIVTQTVIKLYIIYLYWMPQITTYNVLNHTSLKKMVSNTRLKYLIVRKLKLPVYGDPLNTTRPYERFAKRGTNLLPEFCSGVKESSVCKLCPSLSLVRTVLPVPRIITTFHG